VSKDNLDGAKEDLKVEGERPVFDVIEVERTTFFKRDVATAGDLGEAGEARLNREEKRAVAVFLQFPRDEGTWADKGDVAADDVPELGEFVQ